MTSYSRVERAALCDLFDSLGPDAPTLCGDWTTSDLVTHLFIRERRPLAAPAILIDPLKDLAERSSAAAQERHSFEEMVEILRGGAPMWSLFGVMDAQLNLSEYFVHHEDVRRAQDSWEPRVLEPAEEDALWGRVASRLTPLNTTAPVGVLLQRADTGEVRRARAGSSTVTVVGLPGELLLFGYGRQRVARVDLLGEPDDVERLGTAGLGK
ncbi:MAG: TIGR03085 family metal-binding protein [Actinomycetota bacterium]|nr:TIGR03085 family metal-binding protein [Actinomycetota bacterium]